MLATIVGVRIKECDIQHSYDPSNIPLEQRVVAFNTTEHYASEVNGNVVISNTYVRFIQKVANEEMRRHWLCNATTEGGMASIYGFNLLSEQYRINIPLPLITRNIPLPDFFFHATLKPGMLSRNTAKFLMPSNFENPS